MWDNLVGENTLNKKKPVWDLKSSEEAGYILFCFTQTWDEVYAVVEPGSSTASPTPPPPHPRNSRESVNKPSPITDEQDINLVFAPCYLGFFTVHIQLGCMGFLSRANLDSPFQPRLFPILKQLPSVNNWIYRRRDLVCLEMERAHDDYQWHMDLSGRVGRYLGDEDAPSSRWPLSSRKRKRSLGPLRNIHGLPKSTTWWSHFKTGVRFGLCVLMAFHFSNHSIHMNVWEDHMYWVVKLSAPLRTIIHPVLPQPPAIPAIQDMNSTWSIQSSSQPAKSVYLPV